MKLDRMERFLMRFEEKGLLRFLSSEEIALVKNSKTAAGFWAAKEAASKALGCGIGAECRFQDIILSKTEKGAPCITFAPHLIQQFRIKEAAVSITHDGDYAIAVVALQRT